jgi:DNA-binding response OmpR family regulator
MNQPRLLIVDDEENVRFVLQRALRREEYLIDTAVNGRDAIAQLSVHNYDLALLDLRMEPVGGMQVLRAARQRDPDMIVIILTAYSSLESAVEAVRLGAFDYLFKPASPDLIRERVREGLQARRRNVQRQRAVSQLDQLRQTLLEDWEGDGDAVARKSSGGDDGRFHQSGPLILDIHRRIATLNDDLLELTTAEFNLLHCLAQNAPNPVAPLQLLSCALGYDADESEARETIKWHIHQLRHKIEPDPKNPRYIKTVRYQGYLWAE